MAALGTLGAGSYATWMSWTVLRWSAGAPLGWRAQLLLLEGGIPLLYAVGFGCAAWGSPRLRRVGWAFVGLVLLVSFLWAWRALSPAPLVTSSVVLGPPLLIATLDPDRRA